MPPARNWIDLCNFMIMFWASALIFSMQPTFWAIVALGAISTMAAVICRVGAVGAFELFVECVKQLIHWKGPPA